MSDYQKKLKKTLKNEFTSLQRQYQTAQDMGVKRVKF